MRRCLTEFFLVVLLEAIILATGCSSAPGPAPSSILRAQSPRFERCTAVQQDPDWCWAACCEMLYKYHGRNNVTQAQIVQRIKGASDSKGASYFEILQALDDRDLSAGRKIKDIVDRKGFQINLSDLTAALGDAPANEQVLVDEMARKEPCIVGLRAPVGGTQGHAVVVYEVDYTPGSHFELSPLQINGKAFSSTSPPAIQSVRFFDPWPGEGNHVLGGKEFNRQLDFVVSRRRAQDLNTELWNTVR